MTKKIAVFTHASALEGAERSLLASLEVLKQGGWQILVIIRENGPFSNRLEELEIPFKKLRYSWWETTNDLIKPEWARLNYISAHEASGLISDFGAQLVYTNTSVIAIGALAAALANIPHIFHIRELANGLIFENHKAALPAIGKFIGNSSNLSHIQFEGHGQILDSRSAIRRVRRRRENRTYCSLRMPNSGK